MGLKLYAVYGDEIAPCENPTPEDVLLVNDPDSKKIYVWKGPLAPDLDEFSASSLYDKILTKFVNPNIYLLKTDKYLNPTPEDTEDILRVKDFLRLKLPNLRAYYRLVKLKNIFTLAVVRRSIKTFKSYEYSFAWRYRLSNITKIRWLTVFNGVILGAVLLLILIGVFNFMMSDFPFITPDSRIILPLWNLWKINLEILIWIIWLLLFAAFTVDLAYIVFPLKFPINPIAMEALPYATTDNLVRIFGLSIEKKEVIEKVEEAPPKPAKEPPAAKEKITPPKIEIGLPPVPQPPPTPESAPKHILDSMFAPPEEALLHIPDVPLRKPEKSPDKEIKLEVELPKSSADPNIHYVLIRCDICNKNIIIPVPKKIIEESPLPVTDVTYIHGDPEHAITAQLDKNFDVRRRRHSSVVFEKKDSAAN